ncbi:hypothetical protein [Noviherbaspirillum galbum]|uniref:Uncharacterized protein n=1 Tax=Noviherbaspirillum galbum TaxID=2709383 RepID=A0A6B3SGW6_9BURK|nr:hypothetical protein [Noviherbaspirillum galbum]NEX60091.1 hypothetical protein [Noviherbaspirillum galbum]
MMKRSPNLTAQRIDKIIEIIHGWEGRLTWPALIKAVAAKMHATYTRQALFKQERIRVAYETYRASKPDAVGGRPVSAALKASMERIQRLELENAGLKKREALLLEQFVRWAYNASTRGLTEAFLNQALPPTNRQGNKASRPHK